MKKNRKSKKSNKKLIDSIVKIVLVIVIILLVVHNCILLNKDNKSGNINIIEIKCEDKNCENSKDNSYSSSVDRDEKTVSKIEGDDAITVEDDTIKWDSESDLKIFTNSIYEIDDIIAPESSNTYQFIVKNSTKYKIKYNITFMETNPHNINMKYKLKKNNEYIIDKYVSYNELNLEKEILKSKENDTFDLEWKWISSDNDTKAGENSANYKLKIKIEAESING